MNLSIQVTRWVSLRLSWQDYGRTCGGSKPLEQVLREFQDFCQGSILVAHNATFDVGFMDVNYERAGLPTISQPVIDTLEFARNLYPDYKRHGLGPLTKDLGLP